MVNLDHVREYLVFTQTLNYTRAAKELFIAQPTLIQHVQKLEVELGFDLVTHDRSPRLTKAGKLFSIEAKKLLESFEELVERCARTQIEDEERVRVINNPLLLDTGAIGALADGQKALRPTFASFDPAQYDEFALLDEGVADFSITVAAQPTPDSVAIENREDYCFIALPPMNCSVIMRSENPLASKGPLPLTALNGLTIITASNPFYQRNGLAFQARLESLGLATKSLAVTEELMDMLMKSGDEYVSVAAERAHDMRQVLNRDDDLVAVPLELPGLRVYPFAICRKDNPNPRVHEFARLWTEKLQEG